MQEIQKNNGSDFTSFEQVGDHITVRGMNDWVVPWADLMMVMFVLFVVLFVYASTHQDVKVLFSDQSRGNAQSTSTLDPLIGLIGQISSRVDSTGASSNVRIAGNKVLYRNRAEGISVMREGPNRVRISLRGEMFFAAGDDVLRSDALTYLQEIAEVIRLSVGMVHVIGYASADEAEGSSSFGLSSRRADDVADLLMSEFKIDPRRIVVSGRGAYAPELPGISEANQEMNRRVEIIITNEN